MLEEIGSKVKEASKSIVNIDENLKDKTLLDLSKALLDNKKEIIEANNIDIKNAKEKGMKESLIDRLRLTNDRIDNMAKALEMFSVDEIVIMFENESDFRVVELSKKTNISFYILRLILHKYYYIDHPEAKYKENGRSKLKPPTLGERIQIAKQKKQAKEEGNKKAELI